MSPLPTVSPKTGENWTDEQIIMALAKYMKGSALPDDVIEEINPYQYKPSNLPEGLWYYVQSSEKKQSEVGFWKVRGEACEIYTDSYISGWRTTLEFFDSSASPGKRTDWVMQEFKIMQKDPCDTNKPQDSRALCRVFLSSRDGPCGGTHSKHGDAATVDGNSSHSASTLPSMESISGQDSRAHPNMDLSAVNGQPDPVSEALVELDHILRGDYLELDDLVDRKLGYSSSSDSSCLSFTSDEYFDSMALLRDLEDDINKDQQEISSDSKFSMAASARPKEVVVQPATLGSIETALGNESSAESAVHGSPIKANAGRQNTELRNGGASTSQHVVSASGDDNVVSKGGETGKKKLKKKYLCFMPF